MDHLLDKERVDGHKELWSMARFPDRDQWWVAFPGVITGTWSCLTSLSLGLIAPSESLHLRHQAEHCSQHVGRRDAIQRDPDRLRRWVCLNPEIEKGQMQGPALWLRQVQAQIQPGQRTYWEQSCEEGLRGAGWREVQNELSKCDRGSESQLCPCLHQDQGGSKSSKVIVSLYLTPVRPHLQYCIQL